MNDFLAIQFKFNTRSLLKFGLLSLALLLPVGTYTQANANSVPKEKVEVISIPREEAYFIEKKQPTSSGSQTDSQDGNNSGNGTTPHVPKRQENLQGLAGTTNPVYKKKQSQLAYPKQ
ncbi:MAG: hypothetical protein KME49_05765 [Brasilonema octagenarum HA4186-MV1]|jgi:hypothetical protein|uniref:Uncharacterized protein n=2 Tax=Brasilonema TaxID=383614 RepID=A0A856MMD3_9CYAN|nr:MULTISPECIES: hypothetical protein [Brasilonema]MBW4625015.1 hypothetical protein [Brasilonema octagenarum HA4186-MV1]NMF64735.1 hypothetical protein [Brasilonema octagenarum UFV-OR1]QDL10357.1 hypothetical protein DP114_22855 [Brasilonema sennae CENA114]QDL16704.1 hypothetical protein DP113_22760 [Brasilonema octagenarum UFV-E1]